MLPSGQVTRLKLAAETTEARATNATESLNIAEYQWTSEDENETRIRTTAANIVSAGDELWSGTPGGTDSHDTDRSMEHVPPDRTDLLDRVPLLAQAKSQRQ